MRVSISIINHTDRADVRFGEVSFETAPGRFLPDAPYNPIHPTDQWFGDSIQFSMVKPGYLAKSLALLVTTIALSETACAAISLSSASFFVSRVASRIGCMPPRQQTGEIDFLLFSILKHCNAIFQFCIRDRRSCYITDAALRKALSDLFRLILHQVVVWHYGASLSACS